MRPARFRPLRTCFCLLVLFGWSVAASAGPTELEDGTSPDGKLAVCLELLSPKGRASILVYTVSRKRTGRILLRLPCSYKPGDGELPGWSFNQARSASVFWNPRSDMVAIDEAAHRYIGNVLIASIPHDSPAREIKFPSSEFEHATGYQWDKSRIHVASGWDDSKKLAVKISGNVEETNGSPSTEIQSKTFAAEVSFAKISRPEILSMKQQ